MAEENQKPHVNEIDNVALLLVDVINDFKFDDGEDLFKYALPMAKNLASLKAKAKSLDIPVLYVNDNYGQWQSDFPGIVDHCRQSSKLGKPVIDLLSPDNDDYFVLKPQYSGFFLSPLRLLLDYLNVKSLIITGLAGNMCVQFTANDAFMRGYKLYVPSDCVASRNEEENKSALDLMEKVLRADTTPSGELDLKQIKYNDK
ncbi:cysteine hydrolase [Evansella sp. LMS18]|uniref:isochorismatase family cysteine hydrolase n=1 Tax=Evansella sp. LMS18 TaxID=2924033 RepID=UPI0020D0246A|nr:isochorismatase family cysteine hydrolase [Evansella sp. LMS18]UTR11582.1 cysteine hydrolase [Evansella sp. LMS18]